ncbi:MAG: glutamate synthase, partial [Pyrobaculum sp.]
RGEVGKIGGGLEVGKMERYLQALRLAGVQADAKTALEDAHVRRLFSLYHRVEVRELTEEELTALTPYVRRFNSLFNEDVSIKREVFTVITPAEFQRE